MPSLQSPDKKKFAADLKSHKGFEEGKLYEKLALTLLAKRGYELSKRHSAYSHFSIGKEVSVGKDAKFDDIIFKYEDPDNTKNLIFVQIKHKQDNYKIDSQNISAEASTAKGGRDGGMRRDFNLQKYFISYLDDREGLKSTTCEEFRNGKIKYVVLFTNVDLDTEDLIRNGFALGKPPDDILNLFTLNKPSLRTHDSTRCIQLHNINEDLRKVLKKSSDLHRLARVLAGYVVWKNYREKNILGTDETPVKHYHFMLGKYIIEKSDQVKNISTGKTKNKPYCDAKFRDDFIYINENGPKQELLKAIFGAVRELDATKRNMSDGELRTTLKGVELKVVPHFGKSKSEKNVSLDNWITVNDDDINDFLKCLVFFVNQPDVIDLLTHIYSEKETFLEGTRLGEALDNMNPKFRDRLEKDLGIYAKDSYKKVWLYGEKVSQYVQEQQEAVNVSIMTLMYEDEVMQYGRFNTLGKLRATLDSFLNYEKREEITKHHHLLRKVLCIRTPMTLFSAMKILQYLNATNYKAENGQISTKVIDLRCKEFRDRIEKAFMSESHNLLTIECRNTISEQFVNKFYGNLFDTIKSNPNKKIILIIKQNEHNILTDKLKSDSQKFSTRLSDVYVEETDDINLNDFEPVENPLKKETIVFQGQKQKISLARLTGITNWSYFIEYLYQANIRNKQDVIDIMALVLTKDDVEIGSKPLGTSSLEGAYAKMTEKINAETLKNKLLSMGSNINTESEETTVSDNNNNIYIVSGIIGTDEQERVEKLIECLGQDSQRSKTVRDKKQLKNQLRYIVSVNKLQIVDQFKDKNFYQLCQHYSKKQVFWIRVKYEKNVSKFYLEQFYNPNFYLKRTFKIIEKVFFQKEVKELLMEDSISEKFIFHCDTKELTDCLNDWEIERFQSNGKIMLFAEEAVAKATFEDATRKNEAGNVHWLKVEDEQIIWCNSHGSLNRLQMYIEEKKKEISLVEEENLIKAIKDRKILIIADDPGMGKTTTLTNLYESNEKTSSILETHWVIKIHLKDQLEFVREIMDDIIDVDNVVKFLSKFDLKLNHNLAKVLLTVGMDKNMNFSKPLLLAFDGFDELLDVEVRNKIISLFKFLKDETSAKLWITTRLHYKQILENALVNFAIEFNPLDDSQKSEYITKYLQHRLYLTVNEEKYAEFFYSDYKKQDNKNIQMYIDTFLYKMESIFRGDIARFIGTPLQLNLMLEGSAGHFKNWMENSDSEIPVFNYIGNDVYEIYEHYIKNKYDVYFQKVGIRELARQRHEMFKLDQDHKSFALSKIRALNPEDDIEQFKDIFLLVGVIKSQGSYLEFIHKTFEEFFASKVFFDWIKKMPATYEQQCLLKRILLMPDYQLVRTFLNLQLQKLPEQAAKDGQQHELIKFYYRNIDLILPLGYENETVLHIAVAEGNKFIACCLINIFKTHPVVLKEFLFTPNVRKHTALHLACHRDDAEIVSVLLNAAEGISKVVLQEFLNCLNFVGENALVVAAEYSHNVQIFKELLSRANNKLDYILKGRISALCKACNYENEEFVDFLLQEFENEKYSLKQLLLYRDSVGNALYLAKSTTTVEKLISAARSMEDNNETLKNLLLPEEGAPFNAAVFRKKTDIVKKLLNAAKEIEDDNHTLKQLLLKKRYGESVLHTAAKSGRGDVIKLLLETAADLGIEILEKLTTVVDEEGKNAVQLMVENGHERIIGDSFKILKEDNYQSIRKKVMEMFHDVPMESRLYLLKKKLISAVGCSDIKEVKDILSNVKNSSVSPNEELRILLLAEDLERKSTLHLACERENSEMIKELLSYAMNMDDGGVTLKELLTTPSVTGRIPFQAFKGGYTSELKQIVDSLISEARNNNREHAATILEENNKHYTEVKLPSVRLKFFQRIFKRIEL